MSDQTRARLSLVDAIKIVTEGCANWNEHLSNVVGVRNRVYDEAIHLIYARIDEISAALEGLDEPYRGMPGRRDKQGNWLVGEGGPPPPAGEPS